MSTIYEPGGKALEYAWLGCNPYNGCKGHCTYCYVPKAPHTTPEKLHAKVEPKKDFLAKLGKEAPRYAGTDKRVLLSFSSDPYPELEARLGLTSEVLKILKRNDIPFQVLTKSGMFAARDLALYRPGIDAFAVTLTAATDVKWRQMACEPGAAPPSDRIETLRQAHDRGIHTWVSLEPVIDPEESLAIISATAAFVDLYKIGTLNHANSDMTPAQWREFGKRAINRCMATKAKCFIKHSLARHLGEFVFENTDNRMVERGGTDGR